MASYLPPEVIQQIFLKLPVKSIVVCTCVCKFWYNFIKDPNFIATHLNKTLDSNKIHDRQLLLVRLYFDSQERYSLYADKGDELEEYMELSLPFESCDMCFKVMGSCNGLVCLVDNIDGDVNSFILWNPLIEKVLIVPKLKVFRSNGPFRVMVGFGFDCCCNDYKVLRILQILDDYRQTRVKVELFSVKKGYWRNVSSVVPEVEIVWCRSLAFVNGAMHCIGFKKLDDGRFCNAVLGFDVSEEVFFEIMLPPSLQNGKPYDLSIRVYKDSSIAVLKENLYSCQIWVMREYGAVESWTKLVNIVDEVRVLEVLGFRKNGEVLLEKFGGGIVSFDPESKRVQNHGICGKEGYSFVGSYVESLVLLDTGNTARF